MSLRKKNKLTSTLKQVQILEKLVTDKKFLILIKFITRYYYEQKSYKSEH